MSLLFFVALFTSLFAFSLIRRNWIASVTGGGAALTLTSGLLLLHGAGSVREIIEAIYPSFVDGIVGGTAIKLAKYISKTPLFCPLMEVEQNRC